jgi:hypothetical protein
MERIIIAQAIKVAADAEGRISWCPPDASRKWLLKSLSVTPNVTSAANDTNYTSNRAYVGSTAVTAARVTTAAGTALTQGTTENLALTGSQLQLEVTQAAPLTYRVDAATNGTGVAVDISVTAEFEEIRV